MVVVVVDSFFVIDGSAGGRNQTSPALLGAFVVGKGEDATKTPKGSNDQKHANTHKEQRK
jgi:hypothetical protein